MRYLQQNGYHVVTPDDLMEFLESRQRLPRKSVLITMDDGYRSAYEIAYPVLKKYGFKATLMIYTSFVGVSQQAITWEQLRELKADGFTIGSHTVLHSNLTTPQEGEDQEAFAKRVHKEIFVSKQILDQKLGQNTTVFAYPFGYYDQRTMELVRAAGYRLAFSVDRGGNPFFSNPWSLKRDQILKEDMLTFTPILKTFEKLPLR
jgi:peptidoglycan/xylan/chitin deacetylase (PgdA/CDA1 family)